jgi:hypothetical protein
MALKLNILDPNTTNFNQVRDQIVRNGGQIMRDFTQADPWRFFSTFMTFNYDAQVVESYDEYPLVMFQDFNPMTGVLSGHNFHYLNPIKRIYLMKRMFGIMTESNARFKSEQRKVVGPSLGLKKAVLKMAWKEMGQYLKPCFKTYKLREGLRSEIYTVDLGNMPLLEDLMIVPYARFINVSTETIEQKAKKEYTKEAPRNY